MNNMIDYLKYLVEKEGSDLHLCAGRKPHLRLHGELIETAFNVLPPERIKGLIYSILNKEQIQCLEENKELDISYMLPDLCRFRVNIYLQRGTLAIVIRAIPFQIDSFEELAIPLVVKEFVDKMHGTILVTGPQGSGKTTTLAAILDYINITRKAHIMTIEDPIEYLHRSKKSVINQREVGRDTYSYKKAMRYILRQDPDVCMIGELRDTESVLTALGLSEAGVLVLSTLHSPSAPKAVARLVDMFTPDYRQQIRIQLAMTLVAIVSQQLVPRRDEKGRILACEIMKKTQAIENLIRAYSIEQIHSMIQTGKAEGMQTMDQALFDLYVKGKISRYELLKKALDPAQVDSWLKELG